MKEERVITETERKIINKRMDKKVTSNLVFSCCNLKIISNVYKQCGGKATILFMAIIGSKRVSQNNEPFKIMNSFLKATGLDKADISKATSKLEGENYILVIRKPGHKNLFELTMLGRKALIAR